VITVAFDNKVTSSIKFSVDCSYHGHLSCGCDRVLALALYTLHVPRCSKIYLNNYYSVVFVFILTFTIKCRCAIIVWFILYISSCDRAISRSQFRTSYIFRSGIRSHALIWGNCPYFPPPLLGSYFSVSL